jgi:hypothetical protein
LTDLATMPDQEASLAGLAVLGDCDKVRKRDDGPGGGLEHLPTPEQRAGLGAAGAAAGLGCSIVVTVVLCIGAGIVIDQKTGWSPVFTLAGVALALIAAGYQLYELSLLGRAGRGPGPVTRQIERVAAHRPARGRKRNAPPRADNTG